MCMSPHEMSSARIEELIKILKNYLEDTSNNPMLLGRIEGFEAILKERAEAGTYHNDFSDNDQAYTW